MRVSAISFGAWAIGGFWGEVDDEQSMRALHAAIDSGVNFIDTADVYGDGRSERLIARLRRERPGDRIWVATKAGRRLPQQTLRRVHARESHRVGRAQPSESRDRTRSICCSSTARRRTLYRQDDVFGILDDLVRGRQAALLRRQRRDRAGGARRDAASRGPEHPDHLQHVPPEAGGAGLPRGGSHAGRHPCARPAGERPADRQAAARFGVCRRTITGTSTARVNCSTRARRSPACRTTSASKRSTAATARAARRHADPARAALDPDVRRRDLRHSRERRPRSRRATMRRRRLYRPSTPRP